MDITRRDRVGGFGHGGEYRLFDSSVTRGTDIACSLGVYCAGTRSWGLLRCPFDEVLNLLGILEGEVWASPFCVTTSSNTRYLHSGTYLCDQWSQVSPELTIHIGIAV